MSKRILSALVMLIFALLIVGFVGVGVALILSGGLEEIIGGVLFSAGAGYVGWQVAKGWWGKFRGR